MNDNVRKNLKQRYALMLRSVARELTPEEVKNLVKHFPDIHRAEACQVTSGNNLFDFLEVKDIISELNVDELIHALEFEGLKSQVKHVHIYRAELQRRRSGTGSNSGTEEKRLPMTCKFVAIVASFAGSILIAWYFTNDGQSLPTNDSISPETTHAPPSSGPVNVADTDKLPTVSELVKAKIEGDRGQISLFGRSIVYRVEFTLDRSNLPKEAYFGTAWDPLDGTSEKSEGCETKERAIEHAMFKLIRKLHNKGLIKEDLKWD